MKQILIIEDDASLEAGLCRALSSDEIHCEGCHTLREARNFLQKEAYSLILLDVNLPDGNGFDFLQELKQYLITPIILFTANDMETDIVAGLESGAEDYITKPFSLAVLRAKVNAALRRNSPSTGKRLSTFAFSDEYSFDFEKMEFYHKNTRIELSKTEQKLLRLLVENTGITMSRSQLIDAVWTDGAEYVDENALSVSIKRLRDKLHAADYIKTVYAIGYVWQKKT